MGRPAKALSGFNRTVGSNPTLSASIRKVTVIALFMCALMVTLSAEKVSACAVPYNAKRGDSWWSIAEKHGLTLIGVLKLNKAKPESEILVGDTICVSRQTVSQAITSKSYSRREVIQIIRDEWPDDLEERAIQIAFRESKFNPNAVGIPNRCCYGLFQIYYRWHKSWLPRVGVQKAEQLLDPRLNAKAAYRMFQRNGGWKPWE